MEERGICMYTHAIAEEWDSPYLIGVTTMKIYCFPWCRGRPKPENTIRFHSRKEAELAGYRSCKACYSALPHGAWTDQKRTITLQVPEQYRFAENVKYLTRSPNECLHLYESERIYKAIPIENETPMVEIGADSESALTIRFLDAPPRKCVRAAVARYVREWFDLDTDLQPFYELAKDDPLLRQAVQQFGGLRIIGIPDLFEAICWGIIGQQINLSYAYTLKRRLVERFGRQVEWEGKAFWVFPSPETIAALTVNDLQDLRMTTKKCEYMIHVAKLMAEGKLTKQRLASAGDCRQAEKMLLGIRGIGPWTANYVLMRCLRFPDAFPIDDVGLHNAIKHLMGTENKPTKEQLQKLASSWRNWEAYATFYLWRFLY